jgi:hypothetical protein
MFIAVLHRERVMLKRPKTVGSILILIGLLNISSAISKWYFQHDPMPIAISELIRNASSVIIFILCGLVLFKVPQKSWSFREFFGIIAQWASASYRIILISCFIVFMLTTMFTVLYSNICITGKMCQ